jgi:lysyl-tRNA synthetase class 2
MLEEEIVRREKAAKLREAGIDPYPPATARDATCAEAVSRFEAWGTEGKSITLAGRLRSIRAHGGAAFADLTDESGKLQLHIKSDVIRR